MQASEAGCSTSGAAAAAVDNIALPAAAPFKMPRLAQQPQESAAPPEAAAPTEPPAAPVQGKHAADSSVPPGPVADTGFLGKLSSSLGGAAAAAPEGPAAAAACLALRRN